MRRGSFWQKRASLNDTYDNIGQLKTARGWEPGGTTNRLHEQFGYAYDKAWNLSQRTNNALVQFFNVNSLNELTTATNTGKLTVAGTATEPKGPPGVTNVTVNTSNAALYVDWTFAATNFTAANGNNTFTAIAQDSYGRRDTNSITVNLPATNSYSYDSNGNLLSDGTRYFAYDDENQLLSVTVSNAWRSEFVYDGLLRRRIAKDYMWSGGTWLKTNEVRYVYDGQLVIQERDQSNIPLVTYTRGNDLSGTLQDAGGIGGLLARTDNGQMIAGSSSAHAYYFFDANGNVTMLVNTNQQIVASYEYDPYGNLISMSGLLAGANKYRFSSKEWIENAGLYYYGRRFYDPNLQRWLNRDPIQEFGGYNLYAFISNVSVNSVDAFGLQCDGTDTTPDWLKNIPPISYDLPPSSEWPHPFPPLFPPKPSGNPLKDFGDKLGQGLWNLYGKKITKGAINYAENAVRSITGYDLNLNRVSESLGLGDASKKSGRGLHPDGFGIGYNLTKDVEIKGYIDPDLSNPVKSKCHLDLQIRF